MRTEKEIREDITNSIFSKFKDIAPKTRGESNQYDRGWINALKWVLRKNRVK